MKKVVIIISLGLIFFFILISYMVNNDKKYINEMKDKIGIENISYINKYDNKYIVIDNDSLYLLDDNYKEVIKISKGKICDQVNYEIIYRDEEFQYLNDYCDKDKLIYEYYNVYNCELIEKIVLGGL